MYYNNVTSQVKIKPVLFVYYRWLVNKFDDIPATFCKSTGNFCLFRLAYVKSHFVMPNLILHVIK